jgi:hypothetical protein
MLKQKSFIEYDLNPTEIDKGTSWITFKLKNIGSETLNDLDIQLHSLDTYNITVYGTWGVGAGHYLSELGPNQDQLVVFRITAYGSADVYATIKGLKDGKFFWWESAWTHVKLGEERAEMERLLVLSNPNTMIGTTVSVEATLKGLQQNSGLKLEFYAENPSGNSDKLVTIDVKDLPVGEETHYTAEFTPRETGNYTIYAYLYDGKQRLGYKTESIYARNH